MGPCEKEGFCCSGQSSFACHRSKSGEVVTHRVSLYLILHVYMFLLALFILIKHTFWPPLSQKVWVRIQFRPWFSPVSFPQSKNMIMRLFRDSKLLLERGVNSRCAVPWAGDLCRVYSRLSPATLNRTNQRFTKNGWMFACRCH